MSTSRVPSGDELPVAFATHEEVVNDSFLFMNTLRSFHFAMATKFLIPVIGGKEVDLHILYVEVTKRGGFDKVVAEKKWKEIVSVFQFSPKATKASFTLKRHYSPLLYHYEKVYFFGSKDPVLNNDQRVTVPSGHRSFKAVVTINNEVDGGYVVSTKLGDETLSGVLYRRPSASNPQPADNAIVAYYPRPEHQVAEAEEETMEIQGRKMRMKSFED